VVRLVAILVFFVTTPARAVSLEWVLIGNPSNPADTTGFGSVPYAYYISKFEVTNLQYVEFLNAVAKTDTHALYNNNYISRSGNPGEYTYSVDSSIATHPVSTVSFYDALRFANWLHNGQPVGAQDNLTTEEGAYSITPVGVANNSITRNSGATTFIPTENEWYKAAYYDAALTIYYEYPTGTDAQTACVAPAADTGNSANCDDATNVLTDVGSYSISVSPNGTLDQGGNVWEWNESIPSPTSSSPNRGLRGGGFIFGPPESLAASFSSVGTLASDIGNPTNEFDFIGFRVAAVPEPSERSLFLAGLLVLAAARLKLADCVAGGEAK
jgi:formylglycine-generating enzyme